MSNKLSAVLILCMSTMLLAGCDLLRVSGPCYGVGCPGGTAGRNGQYKPGEAPKAQNASAPVPAASVAAQSANAPAQTASAPAQSNVVQSNAAAQNASASAQSPATQSAAAQDASPETKSSPLHSIGEFFARLIPHHNSGAKSGASD
jgi:hypothetical protein